LGNDKLKNNASLKNAEGLLGNMLKVINNTDKGNVIKLQEFISRNLTGDDKTKFDRASKNAKTGFD
jgi:hypothetical protein